MEKLSRRSFATFAALGVAASVLALTTPAEAAPASIGAGRVQLCAQGNYTSSLTFHSLGLAPPGFPTTWYSADVAAGSCQTFDVPKDWPGDVEITVNGKFNSSGTTFPVGGYNSTFTVPPTAGGWKVFTRGTTANGGAEAYWLFG
ncbi:hypothetical protein AB0L42_29185 [Streptomyces sp. NPDC052287]|uniref:hypothetical protein n=1 Tax=Streptomyces sp. NPDC052287 TaxID=3154950 RepID=UPI0034313828